ncbi:DUF1801 domain-containing protein [Daejeonella sp.]|uniref:DUF1801 domain-containing protein n=1 Tax=Daejeonella sp. TaxID=2805397 RepID=UPI0030C43DD4
MQSDAKTIDEYFEGLSEDRKAPMQQLWQVILENIPDGFSRQMGYGNAGFVVPHTIYPAGYHCDPKQPLPFAGIASQKNFIALYHMGIYADKQLLDWFISEYPKHSTAKLDMGKSCIRFKKPDQIPFKLIGELMKKMTVEDWIRLYEKVMKR